MQPSIQRKQPKLALLADGIAGWTGGIDFLRLCVSGINSIITSDNLYILLPRKSGIRRIRAIAGMVKRRLQSIFGGNAPTAPPVSTEQIVEAFKSIGCQANIVNCLDSTRGIADAMGNVDSNVLFPCMRSLGHNFPYGWVGYIPDLQHKRLPRFFGNKECDERDNIFRRLLIDARAIVVNAKTVVRDIEEFYPEKKAELFALPFCPPLNILSFAEVTDEELSRYHLPGKYFLVSNQFWIHKSHQTVFSALGILKQLGYDDVYIVCTGNQHDYRWPQHFQHLIQGIRQDGLAEHVHFLGVVPKRDQLAIMRRSLAVIQPTLFEGGPGGGAIYDAVSTATPAIISDIEVNKEVDLGVIDFFSVGSAEDLANKMILNLQHPPARLSDEATRNMLSIRRQKMGEVFMEALEYAWFNSPALAGRKGR